MRSGSSVILMALAVADTLALIFGLIGPYMSRFHKIQLKDHFFMCKTQCYLTYVFSYYTNWLLIVFTIFLVIAVYLLHKANIYCTRIRAYIAVIVTLVICIIGNLDCLVLITHIPVYNRQGVLVHNRCWFTGSHNVYYTYYVQWITLVFMSIIPFVILIVVNSMIVYKMIAYNKE